MTLRDQLTHRRSVRFLFAGVSGVALALAFPNASLVPLAFVALAPLIAAAVLAPRALEAFLLGTFSLSITWAINVPWVIGVMSKYGGLPQLTGIAIFIAMSIYLGTYGGLFALLVNRLRPGNSVASWLAVPLAWAAVEFIRSNILSGFPWNLLGISVIDLPSLAFAARWAGPFALGAMIAVSSAVLAWAVVAPGRPGKKGAAIVFVAMAIAIWATIGSLEVRNAQGRIFAERKERVAIVQPNITQQMRWDDASVMAIYDLMMRLTNDAVAARPQLILWPESTVPLTFLRTDIYRESIENFSRSSGADIILGSVAEDDVDSSKIWNSAYLVSAGKTTARYDKIHLVPYGEYVPMRKLLFFAKKLVREVGHFEFGRNDQPLRGRHAWGPAICYEVVYPDLVGTQVKHGAEVLVTITNDAWFDVSAAPRQHLDSVRLRAIETDRWMLRAATTGISAIVDPTGRIVSELGLNREGLVVGEYAARQSTTPYVRFGEWFAWLAVVTTALLVIARRKARPE